MTERAFKISDLKLNPNNPRQIADVKLQNLKKSIKGFEKMMSLRPIIIDEHNTVLGGNMRLRALADLDYKELKPEWVKQVTDLTDAEKREFIIKDNNSFGEYDWDALANEWDDLPLAEWGVDLPEEWLADSEPIEEDEEAVSDAISKADELREKWQTETGQLWKLGDHRILCGDSTNKEDVERLMGGEKASLVWTDPPYGVNYGAKLKDANPMGYRVRDIANDNLNDDELRSLINTAFKNIHAESADKCSIYVAYPPGKQLPTLISAFVGSGFEFRWQLIWEKDSLVLSRADYHFRHENILYGWKEGETHYFVDERNHDSIFVYDRPKVSDEHPTMKPPPLIQDMVRNSTLKGEVVYDCFNGSGSTCLASEIEGRVYRGIELEPKYIAVTLERWATLTGKEPELIDE